MTLPEIRTKQPKYAVVGVGEICEACGELSELRRHVDGWVARSGVGWYETWNFCQNTKCNVNIFRTAKNVFHPGSGARQASTRPRIVYPDTPPDAVFDIDRPAPPIEDDEPPFDPHVYTDR